MNLYKPFEILFYTIETIWNDGNYEYVALYISILQWLNILAAINLMDKEIEYLYIMIAVCGGLFIFNWIYFKDKRASKILQKYSLYPRSNRIFFLIVSSLYFVMSFVLFFLTTTNK